MEKRVKIFTQIVIPRGSSGMKTVTAAAKREALVQAKLAKLRRLSGQLKSGGEAYKTLMEMRYGKDHEEK